MAQAVALAALSATDAAAQGDRGGARRPTARGKAAGARRRPRFAVAAVAAGLALAVGMGGYAYASGQLVSVASAFDDVFLGSTAPTTVRNKVGRPVDAVATSD
ncbi:MAG: hypothetical protein PUE82_07205, partial [Parafannyhessea umbonata]|nr:hypothetical protein [Parafannyhessea umbonata]